jgi:hypothetical protein
VNVAIVPVKPPEIAARDRDFGGVMVFAIFVFVVVGAFFAVRRVRARALSDRADRELREAIDDVTPKEDV